MAGAALAIRETTEVTPGPNEGALARLWRNADALSEALRTEDWEALPGGLSRTGQRPGRTRLSGQRHRDGDGRAPDR